MAEPTDTIRRVNRDDPMTLEELQQARAVLDRYSRTRKTDVLEARRRVGAMIDELQPAPTALGVPAVGATGLPIAAPPTPKGGGLALVAVLLVLAAVVIGVVVWLFNIGSGGDGGGDGGDGRDEIGAKVVCEQFIEDRLKSPSSADFQNSGEYIVTGSGATYTVQGYVEADNSFGASLRSNWTCTVHEEGDDRWTLVSLTGLE